MKIGLLILLFLSLSVESIAQSPTTCFCDTSFRSMLEGTTRKDSINWREVKCYYSKKRGINRILGMNPHFKSSIQYKKGKRHGTYIENHPSKFTLVVSERSYQQKAPRRYNIWRDSFKRKGIYNYAVRGTYKNGLKEGEWNYCDTHQRIVKTAYFVNGELVSKSDNCRGMSQGGIVILKSEADSIMRHAENAENGTYTHTRFSDSYIYSVNDHKLNGEVRYLNVNKKETVLRGISVFEDNCLVDSSIQFSINGDTTRIETGFRDGIAYQVTTYTPSSRSTATYGDPKFSYDQGLVVLERKKAPRVKRSRKK